MSITSIPGYDGYEHHTIHDNIHKYVINLYHPYNDNNYYVSSSNNLNINNKLSSIYKNNDCILPNIINNISNNNSPNIINNTSGNNSPRSMYSSGNNSPRSMYSSGNNSPRSMHTSGNNSPRSMHTSGNNSPRSIYSMDTNSPKFNISNEYNTNIISQDYINYINNKKDSSNINALNEFLKLISDSEISKTIERSYELYDHPLLYIYIKKLPITVFNKFTNIMYDICPITNEELTNESKIKILPCGHYYGVDAIDEWLLISTTCPVCRNDLKNIFKNN